MKLTKYEQEICKTFAPTGYMGEGCYSCPLMTDKKKSKCKRTASKGEWTKQDHFAVRNRLERRRQENGTEQRTEREDHKAE